MLDTIILESKENEKNLNDWLTTYQLRPLIYGNYTIDQWLVFLSNITHSIDDIVFAILWNKSNIKLLVSIPTKFQTYFETIFYSNYDFVEIVKSDIKIGSKLGQYIHFEKEPKIKSIKDFSVKNNYTDHFKDIVSIFYNIPENSEFKIVYQIQKYNQKSKIWVLEQIRSIFYKKKKKEENKESNLRFRVGYSLNSFDKNIQENIKNTIKSIFTLWTNGTEVDIFHYPYSLDLDIGQMANFFHIPTWSNPSKWLEYSHYKQLPYPSDIEHNQTNSIKIWNINFRDDIVDARIWANDLSKHIYIVGKTGTGKSTLISQMFGQSIELGIWTCLIDPHGDLATNCINQIPSSQINNTMYFDISDIEFPIGLNLLENKWEEEKNLIVSGIISTFYKIFSYSRWPRLEYILRNAILSVIDYPKSTLLDVFNVLIDSKFRKKIIANLTDDIVRRFWTNEFELRNEKQKQEAIWPITNKIWQLLSSNIVRNIFGQPHNKVDIAKIMNNWQILIVNLSKWKVWEDISSLVGGLLVTKLQIEAIKRANIEYNQRKYFHIYIDEFQNFATDSFEIMLSESRKYKIWLILANQYISQLSPIIKQSVFGNVGTIVSFALGYEDAQYMSNQFKNFVSSNDFISLPNLTAYTKLAIWNSTSEPFCIHLENIENQKKPKIWEKVIEQSRQRYSISREEVEKIIKMNRIFLTKEEWLSDDDKSKKIDFEKENNYINTDKKIILTKKDDNNLYKNNTNNSFLIWSQTIQNTESWNIDSNITSIPKNTTQPTNQNQNQDNTQNTEQELSSSQIPAVWSILNANVKFKYNYWIFVIYEKTEWLLHKNDIPKDVNWKKYYTQWDPITVQLKDRKDVDGQKKAVWTQNFL